MEITLNPSTNIGDLSTYGYVQATTAFHLAKKSGANFLTRFPVATVSTPGALTAAQIPSQLTLAYLERRNAFLPISLVNTPVDAADITAYTGELTIDGYVKTPTDLSTKLTNNPSPVYLDIWNKKIFSFSEPVFSPDCLVTRAEAYLSPLAKAMARTCEAALAKFNGWSYRIQGSTQDLDANIVATPRPVWTYAELLATITPANSTLVPYTYTSNGDVDKIPGAVLVRILWTKDAGAPAGEQASGTYYYWLIADGQNTGWSCEGFEIRSTSHISGQGTMLFYCTSTFSDTWGGAWNTTDTSGTYNVSDGLGGTVSTAFAEISAFDGSGSLSRTFMTTLMNAAVAQPAGVLRAAYTGTDQARVTALAAMMPHDTVSATKYGRYLAWISQQPYTADADCYDYFMYCLIAAINGNVNTLMPTIQSITTATKQCVSTQAIAYQIGYTQSIANPGGHPMVVDDIVMDAWSASDASIGDTLVIPVLVIGNVDFASTDERAVICSSYMSAAEVSAGLTALAALPNFPAGLTTLMIGELATYDIALAVIPTLKEADFLFAKSIMASSTLNGTLLTEDLAYFGQDDVGNLVTFAQAKQALKDNAFFDDGTNSLLVLPITGDDTLEPTLIVTVHGGTEGAVTADWDTGRFTLQEVQGLVASQAPFVQFAPTTQWVAYFNEYTPLESRQLHLVNDARGYLDLPAITQAELGDYKLNLSFLSPSNYLSKAPLVNAAITKTLNVVAIPPTGSRIDAAIIGRDFPQSARLLYSAVSSPLVSLLDAL